MPSQASGSANAQLAFERDRLERGDQRTQCKAERVLQREHVDRRGAHAFLQQRARRDREQRAERARGARRRCRAARGAAIDDEAQAGQREREAGKPRGRRAAFEHGEREDRLHAEYGREDAGREPALEREQIQNRIAAREQHAGCERRAARAARRQPAAARERQHEQHERCEREARDQESECGRMPQAEFGEDRSAAP